MEYVEAILKMDLHLIECSDCLLWTGSANDNFFGKTNYRILRANMY